MSNDLKQESKTEQLRKFQNMLVNMDDAWLPFGKNTNMRNNLIHKKKILTKDLASDPKCTLAEKIGL